MQKQTHIQENRQCALQICLVSRFEHQRWVMFPRRRHCIKPMFVYI